MKRGTLDADLAEVMKKLAKHKPGCSRQSTHPSGTREMGTGGFETAIYEYQADCDGEWGKISFDFESSTAEIIHLADWDTIKTNRFANKAVAYLLNCENEKLPKETMVAFEP